MGRELAAAIGRWAALEDHPVRAASWSPSATRTRTRCAWFERVDSVRLRTDDYADLLDDDELDVLYLAVPHHLHEAALPRRDRGRQGLPGGEAVRDRPRRRPRGSSTALDASPTCSCAARARCRSSPAPSSPYETIRCGALGRGDRGRAATSCTPATSTARKPINWKRQAALLRRDRRDGRPRHARRCTSRCASAGAPRRVFAVLQDIVTERPGPDGEPVPCDTMDNATLHCDAGFPLTLRRSGSRPGT